MISRFSTPATAAANLGANQANSDPIREHNDPFLQAGVRESVWESLAARSGQPPGDAALRVLERHVKLIVSSDGFIVT